MSEAARLPVLDPAPEGLGVALDVMPMRGMVSVRGDLESPDLFAAVEALTGAGIPAIRRATLDGERGALWMSPDELMLFVPYAEADRAVASFDEALAGAHALAVNVSDARIILRVTGEKARHVLAKGAPVDLAPDAFGVGDLRRTRISTVAAAFWKVSDTPDSFEVMCFRSYGAYLWRWLIAASDEASLADL